MSQLSGNRNTGRVCRHFLVTGKVQGVCFRALTQSTARRIGLCGFVRNLEDGRVEVVACGSASAVAEIEAWLWRGPPHARVAHVYAEPWAPRTDESVDFSIS